MTDSEMDDALIHLRAAVIATVARQRGIRVARLEVEGILRRGANNANALKQILSRLQPKTEKKNLFGRLLGLLHIKRFT
jgi:hypothetical protein